MTGNPSRRVTIAIATGAIQSIAAAYFVIDGVEDVLAGLQTGISLEIVMECAVAFALLAGVALSVRHTRHLLRQASRAETTLETARGAMGAVIQQSFREWGLSRSEAEVALFALKGSSISEIAVMRHSAEGTVRSQLSQIYAKAGVKNQPMLMAHFIDELIDPLLPDGDIQYA